MCAYQFPRLPGTSEVQAEPTEEDEGLGVGELFLEGERPSKGHALPADVEELAKEWSFSEAEEDAGKAVPELADGDPEGECVPADQVPEGGSQETSEEREREKRANPLSSRLHTLSGLFVQGVLAMLYGLFKKFISTSRCWACQSTGCTQTGRENLEHQQ